MIAPLELHANDVVQVWNVLVLIQQVEGLSSGSSASYQAVSRLSRLLCCLRMSVELGAAGEVVGVNSVLIQD